MHKYYVHTSRYQLALKINAALCDVRKATCFFPGGENIFLPCMSNTSLILGGPNSIEFHLL